MPHDDPCSHRIRALLAADKPRLALAVRPSGPYGAGMAPYHLHTVNSVLETRWDGLLLIEAAVAGRACEARTKQACPPTWRRATSSAVPCLHATWQQHDTARLQCRPGVRRTQNGAARGDGMEGAQRPAEVMGTRELRAMQDGTTVIGLQARRMGDCYRLGREGSMSAGADCS